jgi:hypothetical protein
MSQGENMKKNNVMPAVATAFTFTSDKVSQNLIEYVRREGIDINDVQLRQMTDLIKSTVQQSLTLTSSSIQKAIG